jgi:hypothetical protein
MSGAGTHEKEDVRGEDPLNGDSRCLVQCKESLTRASVSKRDLEELVSRARAERAEPVLIILVGDQVWEAHYVKRW